MVANKDELLGLANKKRWQLVPIALLMVGLSYYSASRAIDTGSWWQYLMTLIALYLAYKAVSLIIRYGKE